MKYFVIECKFITAFIINIEEIMSMVKLYIIFIILYIFVDLSFFLQIDKYVYLNYLLYNCFSAHFIIQIN